MLIIQSQDWWSIILNGKLRQVVEYRNEKENRLIIENVRFWRRNIDYEDQEWKVMIIVVEVEVENGNYECECVEIIRRWRELWNQISIEIQ